METEKKRVLVADDETGVRRFLQSLMVELGCEVDTADNGHTAFRKATHDEYDLILMDIAMPEWNGLDAIRSLQLVAPERKIIVISAYLDEGLRSELQQEDNVLALFEKPVEIDALSNLVTEILGL